MHKIELEILPIFEKIVMNIRIGAGLSCKTSHNRIATGAIIRIVVTLSKHDDVIAVNKHMQ